MTRNVLFALSLCASLAALTGVAVRVRTQADPSADAVPVIRGDITSRLVERGILRPSSARTYRSPLWGRETEIVFLAPEGTRVQRGDLLSRLDVSSLDGEIARARLALRQAQVDLTTAEVQRAEAAAALAAIQGPEGLFQREEAAAAAEEAARRATRARAEYEALAPLLDKGFITREELERAGAAANEAEAARQLAIKRHTLFVDRAQPRQIERARLVLVQRESEWTAARERIHEWTATIADLERTREACSVYAEEPGVVLYEEHLALTPRRKVQVGDRVTPTQGLITVSDVARMLVVASVRERDLSRVAIGQTAAVRVDALPGRVLPARLSRVGAAARVAVESAHEDKRFEVILELNEPAGNLRPEMAATVEIFTAKRKGVLLVPLEALEPQDGRFTVLVAGRGRPERRAVQVGVTDEFRAEIVTGVEAGERVSVPSGASRTEANDR